MVVATLYPALHDPEAYVDPETFNPDRWLEGGEAEAAAKNWLVFGTGPHYCLGQTVRHSYTPTCPFANADGYIPSSMQSTTSWQ